MDLQPYGDLQRGIKAVRGTARYELLSGQLAGTGVPAETVGDGGCLATVGCAFAQSGHIRSLTAS